MQPIKFGFGTRARSADGRVPLSARDLVRRTAMLKEAADVLPNLPAAGQAVHALMTGRYDLMVLLACLIEQHGQVCDQLRIATLSLKQRNTFELVRLIDAGRVKHATLLCSEFFRDHNGSIYEGVHQAFTQRPAGKHRLAAARSHAKVVTMAFAGGDRLVLEGSANLRTNSNIEQFCLLNHAGVHDWHAQWIDNLVSRGQVHQNDGN